MRNMITNPDLTDMEPCYKCSGPRSSRPSPPSRTCFDMEKEITAKVAKMGCRSYEVGVSCSGQTTVEGKKIRWRDGFRAIYCNLKYNLPR